MSALDTLELHSIGTASVNRRVAPLHVAGSAQPCAQLWTARNQFRQLQA
jgi:hypothetical protein